jgi:hypothetical protein
LSYRSYSNFRICNVLPSLYVLHLRAYSTTTDESSLNGICFCVKIGRFPFDKGSHSSTEPHNKHLTYSVCSPFGDIVYLQCVCIALLGERCHVRGLTRAPPIGNHEQPYPCGIMIPAASRKFTAFSELSESIATPLQIPAHRLKRGSNLPKKLSSSPPSSRITRKIPNPAVLRRLVRKLGF